MNVMFSPEKFTSAPPCCRAHGKTSKSNVRRPSILMYYSRKTVIFFYNNFVTYYFYQSQRTAFTSRSFFRQFLRSVHNSYRMRPRCASRSTHVSNSFRVDRPGGVPREFPVGWCQQGPLWPY